MLLAATLAALLAAPAGTQPAPAPEYAVFGDTLPPPPLVLPLEAPLYRWAEGSRLGLVDTLGAWVLPAAFEEIQGVRLRPDTRPGAPWVVLENPRAGGFRGLTSLPLWVTWEGRSFLLTAEGEWTSLGALEPAGGFEEGRLMVRGGGKVGFVDAAGRATVPVQLEAAGPFRGGHAFARVGGRWSPCPSRFRREGTAPGRRPPPFPSPKPPA